ncbi:hypothetical protein NQ314_001151 [Rhamnusium bicolor]|uniref:FAM234A/B beta-propeller domain-containing protein n=1 Tax=Rhamnusium bicolor TaxID=1586634 RepID=A0AAV8ZUK6_9CUCU|nr:hypothetical protein NQ314_001151 [Rhamnusium bicolor]
MAHSLQGVYSPLPQSLSDSDSEKEISMEPICTNYGNGLKSTKADNCCRQNGHLSFNMNDEILKIKRVNPKMSTLRKTAFVFSILLCFLPIVIFLWVLPCSDSNTCPARISNWEYQQDNIEIVGQINLVHGAFENNLNVALMYKGSLNTRKILKNGIISFLGSNGAVAWDFQQENDLIDMNCSIIDVDGNGFNDCLVVDEKGLKVIETITGEAVWHAHSAQEKSIPDLDMPVKVEDFDGDGTSELLSIYKKKSFLLISGKTGLALSNIEVSPICTTIANLTTVKSNRKLTIENYDHCPHCRSIISFYDSNNTKLKAWPYQNAFVMSPIPVSFQSTKDNIISLKGHVNGFILKIWEWREYPKKKLTSTARVYKRSVPIHNKTYYLNEISERAVLITFNETDTHIINASSTDIYQICNGPEEENSCQPDYKNQQNSLLIADMDHDNSQELISYSSSYVKRDEDGNESWHLVSYLKVFRLESELPKLYGSK